MNNIQMLPKQEERVETGVTQFGDDWPGVFIRGDNAAYYAMCLNDVLSSIDEKQYQDFFSLQGVRDLQSLLARSIVGPSANHFQLDCHEEKR